MGQYGDNILYINYNLTCLINYVMHIFNGVDKVAA